ncbi:MAG: hypothetical protein P9L93_06220 [Candidatus Gorgyraea atricola]|nr:hypothetical protein [Candidatus Gorgyraea atricola]
MMLYDMLYKNMKIILVLLMLVLFANPGFSVEVESRTDYLVDVRRDDGDIAMERLSIHKKLDSSDTELSFFGEAQWNMETDEWEKLLSGLEIGKSFSDYFYVGQSFQFISGEMLDYLVFDADSYSFDTTTKVGLEVPFLEVFSLRLFEEYSINLEKGRDEYCESIAEILYAPVDLFSVGIGWRHTDRIHALDTDYVSTSLTLRF